MITVKLLFNGSKNTVIVPATATVRQILEGQGIDYSRGITNLDGSSLNSAAMDKTLAELGVTTSCMLANVVKTDNA